MKVNLKLSRQILVEEFHKMEDYLYQLPCGYTSKETRRNQFDGKSFVHSSLAQYLTVAPDNLRLDHPEEKRREKVLLHIESLQNWISTEIKSDETRTFQTIKEPNKIERVLLEVQCAKSVGRNNCFLNATRPL